ncbi:MAG: response regulator [bacterium]|nr:response regulator [bacterium]
MTKKILLVDDESSLRRTMALGLSQHGYDTEPCENGVNALKKLESYIKNNIPLNGIVVDLRLPDIDGIKLVKIMKFRYPGVPIIMISGHADRYNMEEIRNLQISAFLEKPFTPAELCAQFVQVLAEQQAAQAPVVEENKEEAVSESAYLLLNIEEDAGFFETYQNLHYMDNVVYCDAVKGDYDVFMLVQAENMEKIREIVETKIKKADGVKSVDFLGVDQPVLDESTHNIIKDAEAVLEEDDAIMGHNRDMSQKVCSYILMEVDREKIDTVYPTLRLDEDVVYCDYTAGKYNLVLMVTGSYFDEIDRFISEKVISLDGVLKVKEYPIVSLFEM